MRDFKAVCSFTLYFSLNEEITTMRICRLLDYCNLHKIQVEVYKFGERAGTDHRKNYISEIHVCLSGDNWDKGEEIQKYFKF